MDIKSKSYSKTIKFKARSGGSFKSKESHKEIRIKVDTLRAIINFASKVLSLTLRVLEKIRSKFSS